MSKGDCFYQPDGIMHDALWMSKYCELLEIASPGKFETVAPLKFNFFVSQREFRDLQLMKRRPQSLGWRIFKQEHLNESRI